jgi:hypothetical protein
MVQKNPPEAKKGSCSRGVLGHRNFQHATSLKLNQAQARAETTRST